MIIVNIGTDKNASFRLIDVIYRFWLNEVNDIIDGFHYKVLIVDKLFFFNFSVMLSLPSF